MRVSVIVPIYNAEGSLRRCVDSILAQSFTDFELILVDDGSKDNSGVICDEYASRDNRVKVVHKKNGGVSSARNIGIEKAIGEWLLFCDADDSLPSLSLEVLSSHITNATDMVMGGYRVFDEEGALINAYARVDNKYITREEAFSELYCPSAFLYQGYVWCKLF